MAFQSRAGIDAIVATVRAALDSREDVVVVSLDGRSAYDSISRAAFLVKLQEVAPELLPFVRMFYGRPSTYSWWDAAGRRRDVHQAEGCEQGDPLAPALFALGQHGALARAAGDLDPADKLLAFLDDLYVITVASRARPALDTVTGAVEEHCGIASNLGKTRGLGGSEGPAPPGLAELGPDVWRGDRHERGMVVLGSPVGHTDFVHAWAVRRLLEEQQLLQQLPQLPDLQCSWLLLALCASPRANHALRTVPPTAIASYAAGHDDAIWHTLLDCLGGEAGAPPEDAHLARATAFLPAALGGLGLQSATRSAPAACWAAWADALPPPNPSLNNSPVCFLCFLVERARGSLTRSFGKRFLLPPPPPTPPIADLEAKRWGEKQSVSMVVVGRAVQRTWFIIHRYDSRPPLHRCSGGVRGAWSEADPMRPISAA